ncbi:MAG: retropepsin-like aspartic protease [Planctomycetota bacterium]
MGIIIEKLRVVGRKGERTLSALFDTGSSHSLIREDVAREIGEIVDLPEPKRYELAVGTFVAREAIFADIVIDGKRLTAALKVVRHPTEELVIGVDFMRTWSLRLDPKNHQFILNPRALKLKAVGMRVPRSQRQH